MAIINYLASTFFKQPPIFLGLVALIGLLVQGKSFSDCLKGTVKTIMGTAILFKAVNLLADSVAPLSNAFAQLYQLPVENVFDPNAAWNLLGEYGTTIGIVLVASFVINLIVARFTPIKNIFLTGHIYFWMSYLFVGAGVQAGLSGTTLLVFAILFLSVYIIVTPALMRPLVKKLDWTGLIYYRAYSNHVLFDWCWCWQAFQR
jgi:ascorbate PTS system EIIC component